MLGANPLCVPYCRQVELLIPLEQFLLINGEGCQLAGCQADSKGGLRVAGQLFHRQNYTPLLFGERGGGAGYLAGAGGSGGVSVLFFFDRRRMARMARYTSQIGRTMTRPMSSSLGR